MSLIECVVESGTIEMKLRFAKGLAITLLVMYVAASIADGIRLHAMAVQGSPGNVGPEELYRRVLPSVLTVRADLTDGSVSQGSGFLALGENLAVTAWHVVKGARRVTVRFADKEEFEATGIVDKDESRDLALLRVRVAGRPILMIAPTPPAVGSRVYAIGSPRGLEFSISDGLVSQIRQGDSGTKFVQFSAPASPGSSGGPLVNIDGQIVGVVDAQFTDGQNLNLAVSSTYVQGFDRTLPTQSWPVKETQTPIATTSTFPRLWRSLSSGTTKAIRIDGDYLYIETELPNERKAAGNFVIAELKKNGSTYEGRTRSRLSCSWDRLTQGTNVCSDDTAIEITLLTPSRIEGWAMAHPQGTAFDCGRCRYSKPARKEVFTWIPQ